MRDAFTGVALLAILGSGARANARSHRKPELHLTVRVYDSAHVGAEDLHQAVERADVILRQVRIKVTWVLVACRKETISMGAVSNMTCPSDLSPLR